MSSVEKFLTAIVGIALVTTLVLPKRQTPQVIDKFAGGVSKVLGTAMGTNAGAKV